mmetsp:Transcript_49409/g.127449  ORF Transcript_49409/g.127449 Transcript_49409/m.127449 type:complete len:435 (+) Transcript_49409:69-1373(+)
MHASAAPSGSSGSGLRSPPPLLQLLLALRRDSARLREELCPPLASLLGSEHLPGFLLDVVLEGPPDAHGIHLLPLLPLLLCRHDPVLTIQVLLGVRLVFVGVPSALLLEWHLRFDLLVNRDPLVPVVVEDLGAIVPQNVPRILPVRRAEKTQHHGSEHILEELPIAASPRVVESVREILRPIQLFPNQSDTAKAVGLGVHLVVLRQHQQDRDVPAPQHVEEFPICIGGILGDLVSVNRSSHPPCGVQVLSNQRLAVFLPIPVSLLGALVFCAVRSIAGRIRNGESPVHRIDVETPRLSGRRRRHRHISSLQVAAMEHVADQRRLARVRAAEDADLRQLRVDGALAVLQRFPGLESPDELDVGKSLQHLSDRVGGLVSEEAGEARHFLEQQRWRWIHEVLAPCHKQDLLRLQKALGKLRRLRHQALDAVVVINPA